MREAAAAAVAARLVGTRLVRDRGVVAGFWPFPDEIDPRPAMAAFGSRHHPLALPRMQGFGRPLAFHRYVAGDPLIEGRFEVMEPAPDRPIVQPDLILVPLLAFDRRGHRLGFGAGFYDRTLAALRAARPEVVAIGLAFACQEVEALPVEPHDQPLDGVASERGVILHRPDLGR